MPKETLFATTIRVLPWTLALLGATLLVLGVMWHHITDADTANGPLIGAGIAIAALALAHLGRLEEAKAMLDQCDNLSPGFTQARRDWKPYADPLSNRRLLEGLSRLER